MNNLSEYMRGWLASDNAARDVISVKRIYIDICDGNMQDAVLFSQIMYWHGTNRETGKPRLQVEHDGHMWLVKSHDDWWNECRLSSSQAKRGLERLDKLGLIIREYHRFDGMRTTYMRVNFDVLETKIREQKAPVSTDLYSPVSAKVPPPNSTDLYRPITETTTETTTHTHTERVSLPDDITWSNHQWEDYRDLLTEHPVDVMQEAIDYIQRNGDTLTPQRISHVIRGKAAPAATTDADLPTMTDAILTGMGCTGAVTDATRKEARESARQLMGVGFTNAEASEYVTWVLRKAKAEGWKASIRSLVTNGRPNEWRNRNDAQAAQEPRPELPQYDPSAMLEAGLIGDGNE